MDFASFIYLAEKFSRLGSAIGDQLIAISEFPDEETVLEQNPNAVRHIREFLEAVLRHADRDSDLESETREMIEVIDAALPELATA